MHRKNDTRMVTRPAHVLECLRRAVPALVPADAAALPELWRWQMPMVTMADVVQALRLDGTPRSLRILRDLLDTTQVLPHLSAPRPMMTTRKVELPRIHLTVHRNPHPPETTMHRNWSRYRENMPVDVYRRLGGSRRILEGDVRRGYVRVA